MVQLVYFLEKETLIPNLPKNEKFQDQALKFANIKNLFTNQDDLVRFKSTVRYIELNDITENNGIFSKIRKLRNFNIHPDTVDFKKLRILQGIVGNGSSLDQESQMELQELNNLIKKLIDYGETYSLL